MLKKKIEIGLKLWATNLHYLDEAKRLWDEGFYDFLELTAVTGSYERCAKEWKALDVPYIIHGPAYAQGLSFADRSKFDENMRRMEEVKAYADLLNAPIIVMHPGIEGDVKETARQLKHLNEPRISIENKPYYVKNYLVCNAYLPSDIKYLMDESGVGFCFDIGHALCAANVVKEEHFSWVKQFLALKPNLFHMTDGDINGVLDVHWHLGKGNFPIKEILKLYPDEFRITLETEHDFPDSLRDFEADSQYIRKIKV